MKISIIALLALFGFSASCLGQNLPKNHGNLETEIFLSQEPYNSLIVAFGGSEGGNTFAGEQTKEVRDEFLKRGFHFLAINYFGTKGLPKNIDRISLDTIYDTIRQTGKQLDITIQNTILLGSSRGGELVLNLASNFEFRGAIALVPSSVIIPFPQRKGFTSSWTLNQKQIEFIDIDKEIIKKEGWSKAVESSLINQNESSPGFIRVEKIKGFVLLTSGKSDEAWPSYDMCNSMIQRMEKNNFKFPYKHIAFDGGHQSSTHFPQIFAFLDEQLKGKLE